MNNDGLTDSEVASILKLLRDIQLGLVLEDKLCEVKPRDIVKDTTEDIIDFDIDMESWTAYQKLKQERDQLLEKNQKLELVIASQARELKAKDSKIKHVEKLSVDKQTELKVMYRNKLEEVTKLDQKLNQTQRDLGICQDRLRNYQVELKLREQCYGETIRRLAREKQNQVIIDWCNKMNEKQGVLQ